MMLYTDSSTSRGRAGCEQSEALRDYAFDELPAGERAGMERHIRECEQCTLELDQLRMTATALQAIPDQEIPQRIAFVSDKIFEPNWFVRFWNSGARLGFASACMIAVALLVSAWHIAGAKQSAAHTPAVIQPASVPQEQIDNAVAKAVAQVRQEDAQVIQTALRASEIKRDKEFQTQIIAMQETLDLQHKKFNRIYASLGSDYGAGQ